MEILFERIDCDGNWWAIVDPDAAWWRRCFWLYLQTVCFSHQKILRDTWAFHLKCWDVAQDVFLVLIIIANRFDPERGSVISFLFGIARNRILRWIRDHSREVLALSDQQSEFAITKPFDALLERAASYQIAPRNPGLPEHYREVVIFVRCKNSVMKKQQKHWVVCWHSSIAFASRARNSYNATSECIRGWKGSKSLWVVNFGNRFSLILHAELQLRKRMKLCCMCANVLIVPWCWISKTFDWTLSIGYCWTDANNQRSQIKSIGGLRANQIPKKSQAISWICCNFCNGNDVRMDVVSVTSVWNSENNVSFTSWWWRILSTSVCGKSIKQFSGCKVLNLDLRIYNNLDFPGVCGVGKSLRKGWYCCWWRWTSTCDPFCYRRDSEIEGGIIMRYLKIMFRCSRSVGFQLRICGWETQDVIIQRDVQMVQQKLMVHLKCRLLRWIILLHFIFNGNGWQSC